MVSVALPLEWPPGKASGGEAAEARRWPAWAVAVVAVAAFALGWWWGETPWSPAEGVQALRSHAFAQERRLRKLEGELELQRLQNERLERIFHFSKTFDIPADLTEMIYDIAVFEDLDPELAFRLVKVESGFRRNAVSPKGAVGLTQILPSTARWLDPSVRREDLLEAQTNLHLGFRYLRYLLDEYRGDVRLALLAYNRGPTTVASLLALGLNPSNGYARAVCGGEPCAERWQRPEAGAERAPLRPSVP
jgi:hypothetical protein